jgi:peptidoglycan/xylan/chitin deacetylase (PgdA/CDA1 family)
MVNRKKAGLITNVCIAVVLLGLGIAVFTADLGGIFISVSAPVSAGKNGQISLMFVLDEGVKTADLDNTIKKLESTNTKATFFVSGAWAAKGNNKEFVKILAGKGELFELGNMGYTGKNLAKQSESAQYAEILNCHKLIKAITGETSFETVDGAVEAVQSTIVEMNLFLPLNGVFDKKTLKCAQKLGYRAVMWQRDATANAIVNAVENLSGGEFILMKPDFTTANNLHTILRKYDEKGFEVVKVGANLA